MGENITAKEMRQFQIDYGTYPLEVFVSDLPTHNKLLKKTLKCELYV